MNQIDSACRNPNDPAQILAEMSNAMRKPQTLEAIRSAIREDNPKLMGRPQLSYLVAKAVAQEILDGIGDDAGESCANE
jgi:hypothetical protein